MLPAGCVPMPVVKADAYGHGAAHVATRLAAEGALVFAVAVVEEGLELRRAGVTQPILVMGWIGKDQLGSLVEGGLTPNIHSVEQGEGLKNFLESEEWREEGGKGALAVHLKLDTGMTRLGVCAADVPRVLDLLDAMKGRIFLEGEERREEGEFGFPSRASIAALLSVWIMEGRWPRDRTRARISSKVRVCASVCGSSGRSLDAKF